MRILITGSRNWLNAGTVVRGITVAIDQLRIANPDDKTIVIVHGDCPTGADLMAGNFVVNSRAFLASKGYTIREEAHPADWNTHGRAAGPKRNAEMVNLGADICVAFVRDNSRGTTNCLKAAEKAGIEVLRYDA